jgi:hypothetical protein
MKRRIVAIRSLAILVVFSIPANFILGCGGDGCSCTEITHHYVGFQSYISGGKIECTPELKAIRVPGGTSSTWEYDSLGNPTIERTISCK